MRPGIVGVARGSNCSSQLPTECSRWRRGPHHAGVGDPKEIDEFKGVRGCTSDMPRTGTVCTEPTRDRAAAR
ncbi:unnamed protein product [Heligmosomoides polygyrus]|uniref:Uncharacterized protein n=1 Tax=Heligmosomoides polygyrus TaxID=6339 RepID=A0A183G3A9_HELPZ|nr:unnamed protein product [Heligmosomoides polygyrus]